MKRFAIAIALVCVLAGTNLAGDIPSVPAPPPVATQAETDGDMGAGGLTQEITDEIFLTIFGIFAG
jgi:hypothetical protein